MKSMKAKEARRFLDSQGVPCKRKARHIQYYLPTGEVLGFSDGDKKELTREMLKKIYKAFPERK